MECQWGKLPSVCSADSELTFLSGDNVLFKVHRKNLEILAEGFAAPAMIPGEGEVVQLVELAVVLELLFQYLYPQRHPKLNLVEFEVLNGLAEAVEKYQVYPALEHCKTFMQCVNSRCRIKRLNMLMYEIQSCDTTSPGRGFRIRN